MAKNDDLSTKEAFDQTTQAVFRGIAEIAKVHPAIAHNEPAKAFLTVFLPVVGLTVSRTAQRFFADRLPRLSEGYAKAFDNDPKKVEEHAKQHDDDPDYHEVMFRTFRAMADAADPEVVPVLGYLAGRYTLSDLRPDAFFRQLGRLLCDLDPGDLDQLRQLMRGALKYEEKADGFADAALRIGQQSKDQFERELVEVELYDEQTKGHQFEGIGHFPAAWKLFRLLKQEGFGSDITGGGGGSTRILPSGNHTITIRFASARNMLIFIDPQPSSPFTSRG